MKSHRRPPCRHPNIVSGHTPWSSRGHGNIQTGASLRLVHRVNFYSASVLRLRNIHWLAGEASLPTAGEDPVDDGLPDAVQQTSVVRTEHQRLVVFISNWTQKPSSNKIHCIKMYNNKTNEEYRLTLLNEVLIKWDIKSCLGLSWRKTHCLSVKSGGLVSGVKPALL